MFDKLKKALSGAAKSIGQKEISAKVLDDTLLDLQLELLESDVAQEVVDDICAQLKKDLLGLKLEKGQDAGQFIQLKLRESIAAIFARAGRLDLVEKIKTKKELKHGPFVLVFLGINGTGKTTTVAKVANLLRKNGISVVVAAGDTHRAGAIEQLTQHAERLSLKVISQRYGADPSAVGRDAVDYAKKHYIDAVLIDTAGRMQTSKNLMDEMSKIVRVVKPDIKLFVGDSLAGNDTINQAREFFQYANFDGAILTKIDADAKGGAAISIAYLTSKPISYVGIGQGYDDLIAFDPGKFIMSLFGGTATNVQDLASPSMAASLAESSSSAAESQHELEPEIVEGKRGEEEEEKPAPPAAPITPAAAAPILNLRAEKEEKEPISSKPISPGGIFSRDRTVSSPRIGNNRDVGADNAAATQGRPPISSSPLSSPSPSSSVAPASNQPSPPPSPTTMPAETVKEKPKEEKKSRFGGLFGRRKDKDNSEDKKKKQEKQEADESARQETEEADAAANSEQKHDNKVIIESKEGNSAKKDSKRKDDKDSNKDEIVYLTDEDIEDLIK
jgi:fused signal recognition particle receptor